MSDGGSGGVGGGVVLHGDEVLLDSGPSVFEAAEELADLGLDGAGEDDDDEGVEGGVEEEDEQDEADIFGTDIDLEVVGTGHIQGVSGQGTEGETDGHTDQHANSVVSVSVPQYHRLVGGPAVGNGPPAGRELTVTPYFVRNDLNGVVPTSGCSALFPFRLTHRTQGRVRGN